MKRFTFTQRSMQRSRVPLAFDPAPHGHRLRCSHGRPYNEHHGYTEWVAPEERARLGEDLKLLYERFGNATKPELRRYLEGMGLVPYGRRSDKQGLVTQAANAQIAVWWPVKVLPAIPAGH